MPVAIIRWLRAQCGLIRRRRNTPEGLSGRGIDVVCDDDLVDRNSGNGARGNRWPYRYGVAGRRRPEDPSVRSERADHARQIRRVDRSSRASSADGWRSEHGARIGAPMDRSLIGAKTEQGRDAAIRGRDEIKVRMNGEAR